MKLSERKNMPPRTNSQKTAAFTLIEILVVMAILVLLLAIATPALNSINNSRGLENSASAMKGLLDYARAYAIANNTYVYVGLAEVDSNISSTYKPQSPATTTVGGRIAVGIAASKDGTRHYATTTSNQGSDWQSGYGTGSWFTAVDKLQRFENLHLVALNGLNANIPITGGMVRPQILSASYVIAGVNPDDNTATPFTLPLGSTLSNGQYRFDKVIQFNPQGVARLILANNGDAVEPYIEIGLQSTQGNSVPAAPASQATGKIAAIQIDCMTGRTQIYKP